MPTPNGRSRNVTGPGKGVARRGSGLGTGPVGSGSFGGGSHHSSGSSLGTEPRPGQGRPSGHYGAPRRSGGGGFGGNSRFIISAICFVLLVIFKIASAQSHQNTYPSSSEILQNAGNLQPTNPISDLLSGWSSPYAASLGNTASDWGPDKNTGVLDRSVSPEAREKYTTILGDGKDVITIMVYMCGTDLESKAGMASNDLMEMANANLSDNVNVIVYTGGCKNWKNSIVSSSVNQIYRIVGGGKIECLEDNMGTDAMTDPDTLTEFINYAAKNYPANRNMLIFWDHGGGSVSGYGYDEKNPTAGSMDLAEIDSALSKVGLKYDFIGFDACLMATVETDLMACEYADYLIGSEETEPGIGWYYTNWLNELSRDPSMETIDIGKLIIDDFVDTCTKQCRGQKTTLSIVDLAELQETIPDEFKAFCVGTQEMIAGGEYKAVADARTGSREFATSSRIDQIDLVDFAQGIGSDEGNTLAKAVLSAVKYNRTSSSMTNAYGISIYFPYNSKSSKVTQAINTFDRLGIGDEYSDCIREFASLEASGQAVVNQGSTPANPLSLLSGGSAQSVYGSLSSLSSASDMLQFISAFTSTDLGSGRAMTDQETADYIAANHFDPSVLHWMNDTTRTYIPVTADQWELVNSLALSMYYDDGEGYIDLGLDNIFSIDPLGYLVADVDGSWFSIEDQPVAFYVTDSYVVGEEQITVGYVPAFLNGELVKLEIIFDEKHPDGYIAGARIDYKDTDNETEARLIELQAGDKIDFVCDYYTYDGEYVDSYYLGDRLIVKDPENIKLSYTYVGGDYLAMYKFTDIYGGEYWTEVVPES